MPWAAIVWPGCFRVCRTGSGDIPDFWFLVLRRTLIRSFEREMYVIPNAVFSKNTVLNVTRKSREWRFYEYLCVRVQDVHKVNAIIQVCLSFTYVRTAMWSMLKGVAVC